MTSRRYRACAFLHQCFHRRRWSDLQELVGRARASHDIIGSQIPWATSEAEKSRRAAHSSAHTTQEQLLESLLAAHGDLTECLKMHEDLERIAIEQEAEERRKTERLVRYSPESGGQAMWTKHSLLSRRSRLSLSSPSIKHLQKKPL